MAPPRLHAILCAIPVLAVAFTTGRFALGAEPQADERAPVTISGEATLPPPIHIPYLQYGVSFTGEFLLAPGPICDSAAPSSPGSGAPPCILGSGGGVAIRVGTRTAGPWYLGGAYEFSKQDSGQLYRLGILQQLRAEARYYVDSGREVQPVIVGGLGAAGYGNEWAIDTWGPLAFLGGGIETQLSRRTVVGVTLTYRALYLSSFRDSGNSDRHAGIASIVGLDFVLEARDPL